MSAVRTPFVLLLLALGMRCVSVEGWAQNVQTLQSQLTGQPTALPPLTLAEMPPGPTVTLYQDGQLTIKALNATLSDVLRAACNQTGTVIDLPQAADERVVGIYGPGSPREVLASLLNGSRFNYIMLGSVRDPNWLVRLTLSLKPTGPPDTKSVQPATQPVSKVAEVTPIPQLPPPQAKQPSSEPSTADSQLPLRLPRRTRHRGR